jgi:hypothetical protein
MRKRGRSDDNQEEIARVLRLYPNISVAVTSAIGGGFPDIVVGFREKNYLFEIKNPKQVPSKRKLTQQEADFSQSWSGQWAVAESVSDILTAIGFKRKENPSCVN